MSSFPCLMINQHARKRLYLRVLKKAIINPSPKNLFLIFGVAVLANQSEAIGTGWVGIHLILHVQRTLKLRRTLLILLFHHPQYFTLGFFSALFLPSRYERGARLRLREI